MLRPGSFDLGKGTQPTQSSAGLGTFYLPLQVNTSERPFGLRRRLRLDTMASISRVGNAFGIEMQSGMKRILERDRFSEYRAALKGGPQVA